MSLLESLAGQLQRFTAVDLGAAAAAAPQAGRVGARPAGRVLRRRRRRTRARRGRRSWRRRRQELPCERRHEGVEGAAREGERVDPMLL